MAIFKSKKQRNIIIAAVVFIIVFAMIITFGIVPGSRYNKAVSLYDEGNYHEAIKYFSKTKGFKDSQDYISQTMEKIARRETISATNFSLIAIKEDGTIACGGYGPFEEFDFSDWKRIVSVSSSEYHAVGLKSDGTVIATGKNTHGQCDVEEWENVVEIVTGGSGRDIETENGAKGYTLGLKSDGTILATGVGIDILGLSAWKDIISISACGSTVAGIKADGTLVTSNWNNTGMFDTSKWTDLVDVYVLNEGSSKGIIGIKSDGTVLETGSNNNDYWSNVVDFSITNDSYNYGLCFAELLSDGTINVSDDELQKIVDESEKWTDVVAVRGGGDYVVGLKSDGTVVALSKEGTWEHRVSYWKDIRKPEN